jgi:hypothetical protein
MMLMLPSICWASGDMYAIYLISIDFLVFFFSIFYAITIKQKKSKIFVMAFVIFLFLIKNIMNINIPFSDNRLLLILTTGIFFMAVIFMIFYYKK